MAALSHGALSRQWCVVSCVVIIVAARSGKSRDTGQARGRIHHAAAERQRMAHPLVGMPQSCSRPGVVSPSERVAVEAAAAPVTRSSSESRANGRWPRGSGAPPSALVGEVDVTRVYSPLLEPGAGSRFYALRAKLRGGARGGPLNASRTLLLLQDNPNKKPWEDEAARGELKEVDAGLARQIGIGNALDAFPIPIASTHTQRSTRPFARAGAAPARAS